MKEIENINVNEKVLIWAREQLALSQNKASEKTGISFSRLKQLESGGKKPTFEELKALSKAYKRTLATLLLKEAPNEKPLPKDRRTINSTEAKPFHEKTILAVRKARALTNSLLELRRENNLPIVSFKNTNILPATQITLEDDPQKIAGIFRKKMNLQEIREIENIKSALEAYIEKVEDLGIAVFQISLTQDDLRGFSLIDEEIPVIVIKRGDQPNGKIFTLFHELGHIILNDGGLCNIKLDISGQQVEKWCNAFAAELLIPATELLTRPEVKRHIQANKKEWKKSELVVLGNYFHVGPLALLRSLLENNLTDISFYKEKHQLWNKPSFARPKNSEGRNIPKETINEKGKTYTGLAFRAFEHNRIDIKDLSDFLGIKIKYIIKTRELLYSN